MLVLSRKLHERIEIGTNIVLTVVRIDGDKVRIGIQAPREVSIVRTEIKRPSLTNAVPPPSLEAPPAGESPIIKVRIAE